MSNWEADPRRTVLEGRAVLERTAQSLANTHRVAVETEELGAEVVSELGQQRESLLRAKQRLDDTDQSLGRSRTVLRRMTLHVLTNKLILVLIILLELGILGATVYLKHFKK